MTPFLGGILACAYFVIGLYFWRFWRTTRDGLFVFFAAGFGLMCFERVVLAISHEWQEQNPLIYLMRFAAYLLIISGIVAKNRK
jgi:hypothetical protein